MSDWKRLDKVTNMLKKEQSYYVGGYFKKRWVTKKVKLTTTPAVFCCLLSQRGFTHWREA